MDIIEKALIFATQAHLTQKRRHSGLPYIVHPIEVMKRLSDYGVKNDHLLAAAVLHDVLEDCPEEYRSRLMSEFGSDVYYLVSDCTRRNNDRSTNTEKYAFLLSFEKKPLEAVILKIADRFCNVQDYLKVGMDEYASFYALQAYPLYQTFINRFSRSELDSKVCVKVLSDVVDLNITINEKYGSISCFVANMRDAVEQIVL